MNSLDIFAPDDAVITVTPLPEGGAAGKAHRFRVSARFGDIRDRILAALGKATGKRMLLFTARSDGGEELPVCMPVTTSPMENFPASSVVNELAPLYNTVLGNGWTPVFREPSGPRAWTLEVETVPTEAPQQEVGGVIHTARGSEKPAFRSEF